MDTTPRKRSKIITLHQYGNMSQRMIAEECKVGLATVNRIVKQFNETGSFSVNRIGNCGRKRKTTPQTDRQLIRTSKINPRLSAVDLAREINKNGVDIHVSTVKRRLSEVGRKAYRPKKKQLLTVAMKKKRLQWAKTYKQFTVEQWKNVLFSDETHFLVQGHKVNFVRRSANEAETSAHILQQPKHPPKKMFWGCMSYNGPGPLVPIEGMMNSDKYIALLERRVVPLLLQMFPESNGIFQQDSAPCHTSKKCKNFFSENKITVLEWPGNSPDLNPIENLWAITKKRIAKEDCTTKTSMINAVIKIWFHDEEIKNICKKLIESMPKRCEEVIKHKGGHINY